MAEFDKANGGTKSIARIRRIIGDIRRYIDKYGGDYADWRIGIRKSSRQRFLDMQFVMFKSHQGIIRQSASPSEAREILNHFIDKHNLALDSPEVECDGDMVYVYKNNAITTQLSSSRQLTLFSDIFNKAKSRGGSKYKSSPDPDSAVAIEQPGTDFQPAKKE